MSVLAQRYPDTWGLLPKGLFNYGGGGVMGWGSVCGTPNGAAAVLRQMGVPYAGAVSNNLLRWFENAYLPTKAAYVDSRSGTWTPGGTSGGVWGGSGLVIPGSRIPQTKGLSIDCHITRTRWNVAAASYSEPGRGSRCAVLCYDVAYKLAVLINQWKAGIAVDGTLDPVVTSCKTSSCHGGANPYAGTAMGNMKCTACHVQRVGDTHGL